MSGDLAGLRRELDGVRQEVQHDLPYGALVAPQLGQVRGIVEAELDALGLGPDFDHAPAILGDVDERDGFLVELVLARLDAAEVEQFIDEVEEVLAGAVNVAGIFLVLRHAVRPEQFGLQHFGEADDGIERCAQLVAHRGEELRLGDVGLLGVAPGFVRHLAGFFEFVDQLVLFGLVHDLFELAAVHLARQVDEEDLGARARSRRATSSAYRR